MIAIIDYGVGNLFSLKSSFLRVGADVIVTDSKKEIQDAEKIILPGVGAFEDAANKLKNTGLDNILISEAKKGKPLLGICLGMQLLFDKSYENGVYDGLGLIKGDVIPIAGVIPKDFKVPHIGWNSLRFKGEKSRIFKYINDGDFVYFVHSYYASNCDKSVSSVTDYGTELTASVENENIFGCQFHPEKSGDTGLNILKAFCELED
ncbi:MAG TPA: imidazole glycerol phosphate synthase subunit HisH [Clostridiales bacterium]|nr:imidazole glycerol phosphate synthase subunit HisH [Clostridiales bacterium]